MFKNYVKFFDSENIISEENISDEVKDFYAKPENATVPLTITLAATHAGKVTRNNGFYLPNKMREGAYTFTTPFQKPFQVHHDSHQDPVGRIYSAEYVDISTMMPEQEPDTTEACKKRKMKNFINGKLSYKENIDFICDEVLKDGTIENPLYEGLGYIKLKAQITDPEAIQKVLDKRYLTCSVGASTNSATCSVCKQDWADEGPCEHRPGKVYDGVKCVLIAGDLNYEECSFVNRPADTHAKIIEINIGGIQDFISLDEGTENMQEPLLNLVSISDEQKDIDATTLDSSSTEEEVTLTPAQLFFGDDYQVIVEDDIHGEDYCNMLLALLNGLEEGSEKRQEVELQVRNAVLTAKKRKALPSSTFCGPNRSFPVPDCVHYSAALRLLARYEGEGNKETIRQCIERKGKRLGCPSAQEDEQSKTRDLTEFAQVEYFDVFSDEEIQDMFIGITKAIEDRKLDCGCSKVQEKTEELDTAIAAQRDEQHKNEIAALHTELEQHNSILLDYISQLKEEKINRIKLLQSLSDKEEIEGFSNLEEKSLDDLNSLLTILHNIVDIQRISDIINSGLSNIPEETVTSPVSLLDNIEQKSLTGTQKNQIQLNYLHILQTQGESAAKQYLKNLEEQGFSF